MRLKPNLAKVSLLVVAALVAAAFLFHDALRRITNRFETAVVAAKARLDINAAFGSHRLNVLVLGSQEEEGTSDTLILAHLDLDQRVATLVSIPRDTWVDVPHYGSMKINSVLGAGGVKVTAQVVEGLVGAPIDATMVIHPEGAKQLVDAMGGINVNVEHDMDYDDTWGDLHIHLKKGEQYLTGGQVLGYMRYRGDPDADFSRMRRQQQVLREIARQMSMPGQWTKLPRLIQLARKDVDTALTDKQLEALVELYRGVDPDDVRTLTLPAKTGSVGDASVVFVDDRWAKLLGKILFSPNAPPQDEVLVANASGNVDLDKTLVGALRGGGWNARTFIDQQDVADSEIVGSTPAADRLAQSLKSVKRSSGKGTVLRIGTDLLPDQG